MVWHELTGHLEVLWGALVAFAVVVLLTPAVGSVNLRQFPFRALLHSQCLAALAFLVAALRSLCAAFLPLGAFNGAAFLRVLTLSVSPHDGFGLVVSARPPPAHN